MLEAFGDIWKLAEEEYEALVITTNGFVKTNGAAVMGRGVALEAAQQFSWLPFELGQRLNKYGNKPYIFTPNYSPHIITFPVKPERGPNGEPGWRVQADPGLIYDSAIALSNLADTMGYHNVIMPRPGCGNGKLQWEQVRNILEPILDDRFTVVTFHP